MSPCEGSSLEAVTETGGQDPGVQRHLGFQAIGPIHGVGLEEHLLGVEVDAPAAARGDVDARLQGRAETIVDLEVERAVSLTVISLHFGPSRACVEPVRDAPNLIQAA